VLVQLVARGLVGREKAVELVLEVLVEGLLRDACPAHDVVDRGCAVTLLGDSPPDRLEQSRAL
jgi:hypothetical protein